jgi:hypothetical protein
MGLREYRTLVPVQLVAREWHGPEVLVARDDRLCCTFDKRHSLGELSP